MGNIISSPHKASHVAGAPGPRPAKRRRVSSPDSFDLDHLIASPRAPEAGPVLRVEVLRILHRDSKKVKSYQGTAMPRDVLTTKASCRITIRDLSTGKPRVLYCQSQLCDLTTYKNPVGPHRVARVDLPRPFYVPQESIFVNRPDDGRYDLSDNYELLVELEAANSVRWPPLDHHDFGLLAESSDARSFDGPSPSCVLSSLFNGIVGRLKQPLKMSPGHPSGQAASLTNYIMDVDLRWGGGLKAARRLDVDSKPCIRAVDPDADPCRDASFEPVGDDAVQSINGQMNGVEMHDPDDEFAGDQTPSRSLRTREKTKVYNLKVLSDQAQGREREKGVRSTSTAANEGRVQYLLPSDQPVCLDFYRCINCGAYHESMPQLQLHLMQVHYTYQYAFEATSQGPLFRVSAVGAPPMTPGRVSRQPKPFHLASFVTGDPSSNTARTGHDGELFRSPSAKANSHRLASGSPVPRAAKPSTRRAPRPKVSAAKILVPSISQPLFHPISKMRLKPGDEVPQTAPDDTWLIQKHRESIGEFSDVDAAEKEYIWEWDGYILGKSITSAAYFPRAWIQFVQEKAAWLVAEHHRMLEFGKHCSVLLARDLLDSDTMREAFSYINDARAEQQAAPGARSGLPDGSRAPEAESRQSPRSAQIRKSNSGCTICQLPVLGPTLLVCSNKVCIAPAPMGLCLLTGRLLGRAVHAAYITRPAPKMMQRRPSRSPTGSATPVTMLACRFRSPTPYQNSRKGGPDSRPTPCQNSQNRRRDRLLGRGA